jgi:serine/threonine-protein kinase
MRPEQDRSSSIAVMVADRCAVDWDAALRASTSEHERRLLQHLRLLEDVARLHEGFERDSRPDAAATAAGPPDFAARGVSSWGHLEIRAKLGQGAFGAVFRAWDPRLEREVALKLLTARPEDGSLATKVIEEGRLLAKLRHPNVVTVHGAETHEDRVGVWMELVRGRSLEQILREQGSFGAREAGLVGVDLCRALAAVHRVGLIHRDVKAQNAMREEGGRIVLMDFGAGIEAGAEGGPRNISGTPLYMAPEVVLGGAATVRSDIYSLGVLLHRLVSGTFPVEATSWDELRERHRRRESRLLRDERSELPEAFVRVVERATAWKPEDRFATAGEMERSLALALGVEKEAAAPARAGARPFPRGVVPLGLAALAAATIVAIQVLSSGEDTPPAAPEPAAIVEPAAGPGYVVEAALYRVPQGGPREHLQQGSRLAVGDRLSLEIQASAPLHVYVIDEDDAGHAFALFPLPDLETRNPLAPNVRHVLPGSRDGKDLWWTVDTAGGQEHVMVLASPTRLVEFEAEMSSLARPGQTAVEIPETAKLHLRGIGMLEEGTAAVEGGPATRLFQLGEELSSRPETIHGVWMRRIDLHNPVP